MSRFACGTAVLLAWACGGRVPPPPPVTDEARIREAAETALACLAGDDETCLIEAWGGRAWVAQMGLEVLDTTPAPLLGTPLASAASRIDNRGEVENLILAETKTALDAVRDLSCRVVEIRPAGPAFAERRDQLLTQARALGLSRTSLGPALAALREAAAGLDRARMVTAQCNRGNIFLLVAEPDTSQLDPDEDPAAHAAGGWAPFVASDSEGRLLRAPAERAPKIEDPSRARDADPWLPLTELDL